MSREVVSFYRGSKATMPSGMSAGRLLIATDTGEAYVDDSATTRVQLKDSTKLPLSGGTLTGPLDLGSNQLTTSYVPTDNSDVVNKAYLDDQLANINGTEVVYLADPVSLASSTISLALTINDFPDTLSNNFVVLFQLYCSAGTTGVITNAAISSLKINSVSVSNVSAAYVTYVTGGYILNALHITVSSGSMTRASSIFGGAIKSISGHELRCLTVYDGTVNGTNVAITFDFDTPDTSFYALVRLNSEYSGTTMTMSITTETATYSGIVASLGNNVTEYIGYGGSIAIIQFIVSSTSITSVIFNGYINKQYISDDDNPVSVDQLTGVVSHTAGYTATTVGPSSDKTLDYGGEFIVPQITRDTYGHVTGLSSRTLTLPSASGSESRVEYGICSTASSEVAKVVNCDGYSLSTGSTINVYFSNTNEAENITLNVNSTGAISVRYNNVAITAETAGLLLADHAYEFIYDGTYYRLLDGIKLRTDEVDDNKQEFRNIVVVEAGTDPTTVDCPVGTIIMVKES